MSLNNPLTQPGEAAGQASVQPGRQPQPAAVPPVQPSAAGGPSLQYVFRAKQLSAQYGNDPYKLSEALGQVKAAYLAEHHHITPSRTGS